MIDRPISRRRAIGAVGGFAALSTVGCLGLNDGSDSTAEANDGMSSSDPPEAPDDDGDAEDEPEPEPDHDVPENGLAVFVYDDGPIEDVTKALPVHKEFDAPATTGIVSDWVGDHGYMDTDHLDELVANGWEIASHTRQHTTVAAFHLTNDVHPTDTVIHAEEYRHGHHDGLTVELSNGHVSTQVEVAGLSGDPGARGIKLTEPVGSHYRAEDTEIRYPSDRMHESLKGSKDDLEDMGYTVDTLLAPYDQYSGWSNLFVPDYYVGVANAVPGSAINIPGTWNPYATQRDYFAEFTSREHQRANLNTVAEHGAVGVFGAHAKKADVTQREIRYMLELAADLGIEVVTLREAIERGGGH